MRDFWVSWKAQGNISASRKCISVPLCASDVGLTGMWPLCKGGWWLFCLCFSVGVIRHWTKATWRKKWFVWLPCMSTIARTQGKNPEAEAEVEAMEEWCFLVYSFWLKLMLSQFSYANQDHLPRGGTTHSKLCPHASVRHQENTPQMCPEANLWWQFHNWGSLFPDVLSWHLRLAEWAHFVSLFL